MQGARLGPWLRGRLGTTIVGAECRDGERLFVKVGRVDGEDDLAGELQRLRWLESRLPVPRVVAAAERDGWFYLALSACPGRDGADPAGLREPARLVERYAAALRRVHAVDVRGCPFAGGRSEELAEVRALLGSTRLDRAAFAAANGGQTPEQVYAELAATGDFESEPVWTHGDFALPNIILADGRLTGILDWATGRVGDRHRDLVVVADSLAHNCGPGFMAAFLAAYGGPPLDANKMRYFAAIDQFHTHVVVEPRMPAFLAEVRAASEEGGP